MRILRTLAMTLLFAAAGFLAWAGWPASNDRLVFRLIAQPRQGGLAPWVRFGRLIADPAREYPASFYATYLKECSGTLIGRNTIIISAHCLLGAGRVEVHGHNGRFDAECQPHPKYRAPPRYDVALCKILGEPRFDGGFERIARPPYRLSPTEDIRITGWGERESGALRKWRTRVSLTLGAGGNFRVGNATGTENGPTIMALGATTIAGRVALEPGDSGGAAYVGPATARRIVGTNSCGGYYCEGLNPETIALANLLEAETARFIADFARQAHVCGFDPASDAGCRN